MKKNGLKILIAFALFLFSYTEVKAACSWEEQRTYFDKTKGTNGETVTTSCSTGGTINSDNKCTAAKPVYPKQNGVTSKTICCCKAGATTTTATKAAKPKFTLPDYKFQVPIGELASLKIVDCSDGTCNIPFLAQYVLAIYKYGLSIAGVLGVLMLMAAGLLWLVSGGDSGKITQAKKMIFGSVFGLLILVGLSLFLSFINPDLAVTKILSISSIEKIEVTPEPDADITVVGGKTIYKEGCLAAKKGDFSVCKSYGNIQPAGLTTVKGMNSQVRVDSAIYQKYLAAMECVKNKNGGKNLFGINEGFRDAATQIKYWEKFGQGKAAPPCCSNHGYGEALDINRIGGKMSWEYNESSGLTTCMNAQGLYAKLSSEPWHWSPSGK